MNTRSQHRPPTTVLQGETRTLITDHSNPSEIDRAGPRSAWNQKRLSQDYPGVQPSL